MINKKSREMKSKKIKTGWWKPNIAFASIMRAWIMIDIAVALYREWCMYSSNELSQRSREGYFGVYFQSCETTRDTNTKITLEWAQKQLCCVFVWFKPVLCLAMTPATVKIQLEVIWENYIVESWRNDYILSASNAQRNGVCISCDLSFSMA